MLQILLYRVMAQHSAQSCVAFQEALGGAVEKRIAFTQFVDDTIIPASVATNKAVGGFIPTVPELIKAITDSGISIWKEFRVSSEARKIAIRSELEDLRWPPFR